MVDFKDDGESVEPQRRGALRKAAVERLGSVDPADTEVDKILEELRIHQIELEMQHDELQQMHTKLQQSHAWFEQLFAQAPIAYVTCDSRWCIQRINQAAHTVLDHPVIGQPFLSLKTDGRLIHFLADLQILGKARTTQVALKRGAGRFEARLHGRRVGDSYLLAIEDVSVAARAHKKLSDSQHQLNQILKASPDGVVVLERSRVLFANPAICNLIGLNSEDVIRRPFTDHIDDDCLPFTPVPDEQAEVRLRDAQGEIHIMEYRAVRIDYAHQVATLLLMRDITERRRFEDHMARTDRLAAIGTLVAGVSHELNNPLTFILGNLEVLALKLQEGAPELARMAREALTGTRRLANIVTDLRTFQHADEDLTSVDVNTVIVDTLSMAEPKLRAQVCLSHDLGQLPVIEAHEARLGQVVLNLVLNAVEAMPERPAEQNSVIIKTYRQGEDICIAVEDNGNGIDPAIRHHIFDPFFSTRKPSGGTGLGLAVSSSMIQEMGGFIALAETGSEGTRFVIHLPVRSKGTLLDTPPQDPHLPTATQPDGSLQILVVDDELSIGRIVSRILDDCGEVHLAGSGRAAIRRLAAGETFDVIISDVVMHHGSGIELGHWLDAHQPEMARRLILMSGLIQEHQHWPVLRKPLNFDALRSLVLETGLQRLGGSGRAIA